MGHLEKSGVNGGEFPSTATTTTGNGANHHAIKIIQEDEALTRGMQRSRSSSVQFHLPLSGSNFGGGLGGEKSHHLGVKQNLLSDALPSPSLTKPFRLHPMRRRKSWIYTITVVGAGLSFVILLIILLSSPSSPAQNAVIARHAAAISSTSQQHILRLSSLVGSYLPFLDSASISALTTSALLFGYAVPGVHTLHPILPTLRSARTRQAEMTSRQSTSYAAVTAEYRKRYKQDPPPGFDKWWSFAKARNHTIVDEYDAMMRDILPFSQLSADVLRQRTRTLSQLPGVSLITIKGGQAQIHSKSGRWAPALAMQEMMNAFVSTLPDMEIAINEKQEGRVLPGRWKEVNQEEWDDEDFPWTQSEANKTDPLADVVAKGWRSSWGRDGASVWTAYQRACPPESAARRLVESVRSAESASNSRQMRLQLPAAALQQQSDVLYTSALSRRRANTAGALPRTRELSFNNDLDAEYDLCNIPSMHALHSAFFSDVRSIQYLYPLFSPSKPTGFADLLIPFHQYWSPPSEVTYEVEFRKGRSKVPADLDWWQKDDKVFWRGKMARGADTPAGHFASFQKPRLVHLANDDGSTWQGGPSEQDKKLVKPRVAPHRVLVTVNATTSSLVSMSAPGPKINEHTMDVALACDPTLGECADLAERGYKVVAPGPLSEAWKHKYVVDLDEVGLSNRFPALMESKSVVLKASVQMEFWQDWIVPWYHYIPISSSYAELYNVQSFFSGFPKAFQNRRATSASAPNTQANEEVTIASAVDDSDALASAAGGAVHAGAVTLKTGATALKPINPAHGKVFNGDLALKDIAEQGAQWRREHLRREDMEVYVFRLLLEWARLVGESSEK